MTRINTNVSSLVAQNRLSKTNNDLQTALTRLSTGLRINNGKDDPAGLLASEALRSDITSLNKAISNTQRANQVIATADSALGQVSTLLNNVRGLVVEAANSGSLSESEIAANQLQIDSSLEAINRIAQTTTFQGRKLLDGSLDFVSNLSTIPAVQDFQIDQANLGTTGSVAVNVTVEAAATKAELVNSGFAATNATATINFGARGDVHDIAVSNDSLTADATVTFAYDAGLADGEVEAVWDAGTNTLTVSGNETVAGTITKGDIAAAISAVDGFDAAATTPGDNTGVDFTNGGTPLADATLTASSVEVDAVATGSDFNDVRVQFTAGASTAATYNSTNKTISVTYVSGTDDVSDIATAINGLTDFNASATGGTAVSNASDASRTGNTGFTGGQALQADLVFELGGAEGSQVFNFEAGTKNTEIIDAINLVKDSTGVSASVNTDGGIDFESTGYGSKGLVSINVVSEGSGGNFSSSLDGIRENGTDIQARVNGTTASGDGNKLSINTSALKMSLSLDPTSSTTNFNFNITGGGAVFQLGGDVASSQQARLGIGSVSTGTLGGVSGRLYELATGQAKSLSNDVNGAAKVVDEVISKINSLRGRLGAFQATTLDSNLASLSETVNNLTEAESSIRDADFAAESAKLTRAQILVQSGNAVLSIANQNPQNVLNLLR